MLSKKVKIDFDKQTLDCRTYVLVRTLEGALFLQIVKRSL